jgi:hypothetical protein
MPSETSLTATLSGKTDRVVPSTSGSSMSRVIKDKAEFDAAAATNSAVISADFLIVFFVRADRSLFPVAPVPTNFATF